MRSVRSMFAGGDVRFPTPIFIQGNDPLFPDAVRAEQVARVREADRARALNVSPFAFLWTSDPTHAFALVIREVIASGERPSIDGNGILARLMALGHPHDEARAFVSRVLEATAGFRSRGRTEPGSQEETILRASALIFLGLPMEQVAACRAHYQPAAVRGDL